jgi:nucleotide-binding universal stress UspA family protein
MEVVLGVDKQGQYWAAAHLLSRLKCAGMRTDLVHVIDLPMSGAVGFDPIVGIPAEDWDEILKGYRYRSEELLARAQLKLEHAGTTTRALVREDSSVVGALLSYADEVSADLIAVGSSNKGRVAAWLTSSVGRGLVIGAYCSVLVAKGEPGRDGPVRAVLATDHSEYADRCVQELLRFAPHGLSHLTTLTAYPAQELHALQPYLPDLACDLADSVVHRLDEKNQDLRKRLEPLGCAVDCRIAAGQVDDAIHACMAETGADLLILGAQGHGFWERLTLGSTSFHQAFAEAYPVLVLRARNPSPSGAARQAAAEDAA